MMRNLYIISGKHIYRRFLVAHRNSSSLEMTYYTRIFLTISPYRSFLRVIFLLLRKNPIIIRINPKNPKKLSVESVNGTETGVDFVRSAILRLPVFTVATGVVTMISLSSIANNEMRIIVTPRPKTVHFQIFFRKTPGSKIPRISPIRGNTYSAYLISSGRPNSVRVTVQPK